MDYIHRQCRRVMPALVAGIHAGRRRVDGRVKPGHDARRVRCQAAAAPQHRDADDPRSRQCGWTKPLHTGVLVLASGEVIEGYGLGAVGEAVGEVCFNTAMTGYQEILTDPSYAAQIVTFTFPHIGNVGTNDEDIETVDLAHSAGAVGAIFGAPVTDPSNFRAQEPLTDWLDARGIVALCGIDTRALTTLIRERGMPNAVIAHAPDGVFDIAALARQSRRLAGHRRDGPRAERRRARRATTGARRHGGLAAAMARARARRNIASSPSTMA